MNMKFQRVFFGCILLFLIVGSIAYTAPARVSAKPIDEKVIKVYAYKINKLAVQTKTASGFLVDLANEIIIHPEFPVEVQVVPAAVLMKYSLIQSVGVAALGMESDFSNAELKDLLIIPLYESAGKKYSLFLNTLNPIGASLYDSTVENLNKLVSDGSYDDLKKKYNLN
jgi:hypothetical protein